MFEAIKKFFNFSDNKQQEEQQEEQEEQQEEQIIELPEQLEVPWNDITHLKNIEVFTRKTHEEIKEFLYTAKQTEVSLYKKLDRLAEIQKEKLIELHEKYNVPQDGSYDVELPATTGRSGFFKKVGK